MSKKVIVILLGVLILVAVAILVFRNLGGGSSKVKMVLSTDEPLKSGDTINIGEPLSFRDETEGATTWLWAFGDGSTSVDREGTYTYENEGEYTISLIVDGSDKQEIKLHVKDPHAAIMHKPDEIKFGIQAPAFAVAGQSVTFKAIIEGDHKYQWDFKDEEISTDQNPTHKFAVAGKYAVTLTVDGKTTRQHIIKIKPEPIKVQVDGPDAIKAKLQQIAKGGMKNYDTYYPLLKKQLCNDESVPVNVHTPTENYTWTFFRYCQELLNESTPVKITDVKLTRDAGNCINSIQITQKN